MGWISVADRLPETDGKNTSDYNVLVYIPKRKGCRQHGIYVGNFWGLKTESSEWMVWGWGYYEHPVITHWMPLPKSPGQMTNGDRIRAMTEAELYELFRDIYNAGADDAASWEWGGSKDSFEWDEDWLQQPAKED